MGGVIAQEIYNQAPSRCRSLILVSTFDYAPKMMRSLVYAIRKQRASALPKEMAIELSARTCLYSWDKETLRRFIIGYAPNWESYMKAVEACLHVDYRWMLRKINVPTLVIGGQYDTITPVWCQILMHQRIPRSKLVILRNCGHLAKLEKPDEFNEVLSRFLQKDAKRLIS
jgi:pimeloyl-ACP methyl ester carboxylesterase